jgi:phage tail-like protein
MSRIDPYPGYNFLITLMDSASVLGTVLSLISKMPVAGFSECSGLEMSLDIEEYKEGGNNGTILRFPTRVKWTNLRLKRGLAISNDLWLWHYGFVQGTVNRHDGIITLIDQDGSPAKAWAFKRGLPVKWAGPAFNATQGQIAFEEIEIAHEGLKLL